MYSNLTSLKRGARRFLRVRGEGLWLVDLLVPAIDEIAWLQTLSPFHWFMDPEPMMNGFDLPSMLVLAAIAVAGFVVALVAFERRDLAA